MGDRRSAQIRHAPAGPVGVSRPAGHEMRKPTQRPVWRILCAWFTGLLLADLVLMRLRTADVAANVRISDEREAAVDPEQSAAWSGSGLLRMRMSRRAGVKACKQWPRFLSWCRPCSSPVPSSVTVCSRRRILRRRD